MTEDEVFDNNDAPGFDDSELFGEEEEFVLDEWDLTEEEDDQEVAAGDSPMALAPDLPDPDAPSEELAPAASGLTAEVDSEASAESEAVTVVDQDEHDMLFGDMTEDRPENSLGDNRTFAEEGGGAWAGDDTDLEDLGMEMVSDGKPDVPRHMAQLHDDGMFDIEEGDDLILIDSEADLETEFDIADDLTIDFDEEDEAVVFEDAEIAPVAIGEVAEPAGSEESVEPEAFEQEEYEAADPIDSEFQEFAGGLGADLSAAGTTAEGYGEDAGFDEPDIDYEARDFDTDEKGDETEWAPVSEFDEDEEEYYEEDEDGDDGEEYEEYEDGDEDQDFAEHEEGYYEHSHDFAEYADERRSPVRWIAGIAAALLISAAGAFWYLKTDSLTPDAGVDVIEVIKVPRPNTGVKVGQPDQNVATVVPTIPVKKDPTATTPKKDPTATTPKKDPVAVTPKKDPVTPVPTPKKDPDSTTPKRDPETAPAPQKDPVAARPKDPKRMDDKPVPDEMVNVGGEEGHAISEVDEGLMSRHERTVVEEFNGLVMGSQALAQLTNENIFVGRVKALNSSAITIRTAKGEITLLRSDLRALTTLADAEFEEWKGLASTGLVRLRNSNRLKGKIVEARDDAVILMVNSNRVIIPKSAIESVSSEVQQGVNLDVQEEIESDDWFRQLVERKIEREDAEKIEGKKAGIEKLDSESSGSAEPGK
jgi:hypothetical protein